MWSIIDKIEDRHMQKGKYYGKLTVKKSLNVSIEDFIIGKKTIPKDVIS